MWTVVYIAPTKSIADKLIKALSEEGLLVKKNEMNPNSKKSSIEIIVPESEAEEANEIINKTLIS